MEYIQYSESIQADHSAVVTVGTFDGVHLGHRAVLDYLIERAKATDGRSTVITFDPHPREIIRSENVALLTTVEERARQCARWGIDRFIVVPFTKAFSETPAEEFVTGLLKRRIGMQEIVIGHDHSFGRGGRGNATLLHALSSKSGFTVDTVPAEIMSEITVSSSRIRHLIESEAKIIDANKLLGYEYGFSASVIRGSSRGREIGFPTANLALLHPRKIIPADGVYAVRVLLETEAPALKGMMNIGVRPTFDESVRTIEVHILDYDDDLYDQQLRVEFVERLRDERHFNGIEDLVRQLNRDKVRCIASLKGRH